MTRESPKWNTDGAKIIEDDYSFTPEERETTATYDELQDKTYVYCTKATDITKLTYLAKFVVEELRKQSSGNITAVKGYMFGHRLTIRK